MTHILFLRLIFIHTGYRTLKIVIKVFFSIWRSIKRIEAINFYLGITISVRVLLDWLHENENKLKKHFVKTRHGCVCIKKNTSMYVYRSIDAEYLQCSTFYVFIGAIKAILKHCFFWKYWGKTLFGVCFDRFDISTEKSGKSAIYRYMCII